MTDPIFEAAERALKEWYPEEMAKSVLAAVTPLIEAAALERAAKVAEGYDGAFETQGVIAAAIRALKEKP